MNNITMDKQYRYRNGNPARVLCVDGPKENFPVISVTGNGAMFSHTADGHFLNINADEQDLIEVIPKWRGEIWISSDGRAMDLPDSLHELAQGSGWRKITAEEVEP